MEKIVKITAGSVEMTGKLNESATAEKFWDALPLEATANIWGKEVYFDVPVETGLEHEQETVESGDIAYWPSGPVVCFFFGPTPISGPGEIRPASAVNVIGKLIENPEKLCEVSLGEKVLVEKALI